MKRTLEEERLHRTLKSVVTFDPKDLQLAPDFLKGDKDHVIKAIRKNVNNFVHASEELQQDKDVVLEAMRKDGVALFWVKEPLRSDKDVVLAALNSEPNTIVNVPDSAYGHKEVIIWCIKHNLTFARYGLMYLPHLKEDRDIVLKALNFLHIRDFPKFKSDWNVCLKAIKYWALDFEDICVTLQKDKIFIKEALKENFLCWRLLAEDYKADKTLILLAIKYGLPLEMLPDEFQRDREIFLAHNKQWDIQKERIRGNISFQFQ